MSGSCQVIIWPFALDDLAQEDTKPMARVPEAPVAKALEEPTLYDRAAKELRKSANRCPCCGNPDATVLAFSVECSWCSMWAEDPATFVDVRGVWVAEAPTGDYVTGPTEALAVEAYWEAVPRWRKKQW